MTGGFALRPSQLALLNASPTIDYHDSDAGFISTTKDMLPMTSPCRYRVSSGVLQRADVFVASCSVEPLKAPSLPVGSLRPFRKTHSNLPSRNINATVASTSNSALRRLCNLYLCPTQIARVIACSGTLPYTEGATRLRRLPSNHNDPVEYSQHQTRPARTLQRLQRVYYNFLLYYTSSYTCTET